jgi:hypothetical protein
MSPSRPEVVMEVVVSGERSEVIEGANLRALSARVESGASIPSVVGQLDDDSTHLWVNIDWLRGAATTSAAPSDVAGFHRDFDGMIGFATQQGWVSPDGSQVRAHLA